MLAELHTEYQLALPMKLAEMESLWQRVEAGEAPALPFAEMHRVAHTIAGSAGTFGLTAVSVAARALEVALTPLCGDESAIPANNVDQIGALLEALKQSAKKCRPLLT